jgi:hypothetical protein
MGVCMGRLQRWLSRYLDTGLTTGVTFQALLWLFCNSVLRLHTICAHLHPGGTLAFKSSSSDQCGTRVEKVCEKVHFPTFTYTHEQFVLAGLI